MLSRLNELYPQTCLPLWKRTRFPEGFIARPVTWPRISEEVLLNEVTGENVGWEPVTGKIRLIRKMTRKIKFEFDFKFEFKHMMLLLLQDMMIMMLSWSSSIQYSMHLLNRAICYPDRNVRRIWLSAYIYPDMNDVVMNGLVCLRLCFEEKPSSREW